MNLIASFIQWWSIILLSILFLVKDVDLGSGFITVENKHQVFESNKLLLMRLVMYD